MLWQGFCRTVFTNKRWAEVIAAMELRNIVVFGKFYGFVEQSWCLRRKGFEVAWCLAFVKMKKRNIRCTCVVHKRGLHVPKLPWSRSPELICQGLGNKLTWLKYLMSSIWKPLIHLWVLWFEPSGIFTGWSQSLGCVTSCDTYSPGLYHSLDGVSWPALSWCSSC